MEGNNSRGDDAIEPMQYFDEIVPSVHALLFMLATFGLFTIMIWIIVCLYMKDIANGQQELIGYLKIIKPVDRQKHVQFKHPNHLDQADKVATEYESVKICAPSKSSPSRFIQGLICDNCFVEGHKERHCINPRAPRPPLKTFYPGVWCHRCRHEGHVVRSCPNPRSLRRYSTSPQQIQEDMLANDNGA